MFPNSVKYQCDLTSIPFSGSVKRFRRRQEPSLDFRLNFNQKRTISRYFFEISGVILKRERLAALKIQPNGKSSVKNGDGTLTNLFGQILVKPVRLKIFLFRAPRKWDHHPLSGVLYLAV